MSLNKLSIDVVARGFQYHHFTKGIDWKWFIDLKICQKYYSYFSANLFIINLLNSQTNYMNVFFMSQRFQRYLICYIWMKETQDMNFWSLRGLMSEISENRKSFRWCSSSAWMDKLPTSNLCRMAGLNNPPN